MDAKEIKKRLLEEDRIEKILEALDCEYIGREQRGSLITAQLPDKYSSANKRAVQVYANEFLSSKIRNRADFKGDIFSLVSYIKFSSKGEDLQDTFKDAMNFIVELFGWQGISSRTKPRKDYVAPLKALASKSKKYAERYPNEIISESVLKNFRNIPSYDWLVEGIDYQTQLKYNIGFDYLTHRITIPIRNENGKLVGVKGRLINPEDVDEYNPKYKYVYNCNMSQEWFNMDIAKEEIIKHKKVYIFESEKSCMKMYGHGIKNTLAISSSDISDAQALMVRALGIDIDIILCYDKDKELDDVMKQAEKFNGRNVYAIMDLEDKLGSKDSPIDCGIEIWNYLVENHCYPVIINKESD